MPAPAITCAVIEEFATDLARPTGRRRLFVSDATTRTHVARIVSGFGLRDRVQPVIYAYEVGLATPGAR
jgi:hypothetical protein